MCGARGPRLAANARPVPVSTMQPQSGSACEKQYKRVLEYLSRYGIR